MNRFKRIAFTAFAVAALASTMARAQDAPQADAADGKRIYLADGCFTCHGRSGQGGAYTGPAPILAHTALPFDGFKEELRNPVNDMRAYSEAVLRTRTSSTSTRSWSRCQARGRRRTSRSSKLRVAGARR